MLFPERTCENGSKYVVSKSLLFDASLSIIIMSQDSGGTPRRIVRLPITSVAKPSTISKRQIHEAIQDDAAESKFVITSNAIPCLPERALIIFHSRDWNPSPECFCCI
jgi:hypothetical protein